VSRPCLSCSRPTANGSRCPSCARAHDQTRRPSPRQRGYGPEYRRRRAQLLATDDTCWLCGKPGADTADHVIPVSQGGADGPLRPAHKRCNSARGNRT